MSNHFDIPSWAGKPPSGLHLDVMKRDGREDKLIQKLMIDEKRCYLFGRNPQINDVCIDHASCSRVHAAFVYHKHLHIAYLVDLGSTHGTFIGSVRLEGHKPTQLQINSQFSFGASTRHYILRERPTVGSRTNIMEDIPMMDTSDGTFLGLPESQTELDNLTEYNTAHNRRISMLGIADDSGAGGGGPGGPGGGPGSNNGGAYKAKNKKRKRKGVAFNEDEIIINPEDIDPSIGRFRNLIQSTVVPVSAKRAKMEGQNSMGIITSPPTSASKTVGFHLHPHHHQLGGHQHHGQAQQSGSFVSPSLYHGIDPVDGHGGDSASAGHDGRGGFGSFDMDTTSSGLTTKLGIMLPNPAPDVNPTPMSVTETATASAAHVFAPPGTIASGGGAPSSNSSNANMSDNPSEMSDEPKKKKYAKEQWPGRKPLGLGSF
ncbi:nuclear inhibitor of protein phosphatase 1 isoform X2 [Anopheles aquasalis]|uniref:nuclear inhibitor of protein phosphatase 1 isoform X2 n=1 Tax=Anopheles aquasalis TaxID=42839 RepID=UPI00215A3B6F|nr:nuclear inhibitor of protein phosphatase 1 isoform X2 [Anopheles aquasalis]